MRTVYLALMSLCVLVFTGCVSSGTNEEVASEYAKFKASLPPATWEETGYPSIDSIGSTSAALYSETYQLLQNYINATENNRYYVGLMNEVDIIKKEEGLEDVPALQKALANIDAADKARKPGTEAVLPHVIEGYNAVQALKPSSQIVVLVKLLARIAVAVAEARNISNDIQDALQTNPFALVKMARSLKNVTEQLYNTQLMAQYIKIQYDRNAEMTKYMQE